MYLNVFKWPDAGITLPGLQTTVRSARAVRTNEKLRVIKNSDGSISISRPNTMATISTTIALSLDGPPVVSEPEVLIGAGKSGEYTLGADDAVLDGSEIKVQDSGDNANIGFWTNPNDSVTWKINTLKAGSTVFGVQLSVACPPGVEGSTFEILLDGKTTGLVGTVAKTQGWNNFEPMTLSGNLELFPGKHSIQLKVKKMPNYAVMNLRQVLLIPKSR